MLQYHLLMIILFMIFVHSTFFSSLSPILQRNIPLTQQPKSILLLSFHNKYVTHYLYCIQAASRQSNLNLYLPK
jgi:hypothetical protein